MIIEIKNPLIRIPDFVDIIYENFIELENKKRVVHSHEEIKRLLLNVNNYCLISVDQDMKTINGYLIGENIMIKNKNVFYLTYIYVSKLDRNKKIGSTLIDKLIGEYCKRNKMNEIKLICENRMYEYYKRWGFKKDINIGEEMIILKLEI